MADDESSTAEDVKKGGNLLKDGYEAVHTIQEMRHIAGGGAPGVPWMSGFTFAEGLVDVARGDLNEGSCELQESIPLIGVLPAISGCGMPYIVPGTGMTQDQIDYNYRAGAQSIDPTAAASADANAQAQAQVCEQ